VMVSKMEKAILKEWKEHKENCSEDYEWFECGQTDTDANWNYSVGCEICEEGKKTIVLKTKKEADDYSKKEKEKFGGCSVCDRFERLLKVVRKQPEVVRE